MKNKIQLSIALTIALVLSLIGLNVWAAPERQGTVPVFPDLIPITALIPVTGGTYQVELLCDCPNEGLVTRIPDPEEQIGSAPNDQKYLSDAVEVELEGPCNIEICYPYPREYENQKGQIYKWDTGEKEWEIRDTIIYEDPQQICTIDYETTGGQYALISSDEIISMQSPSRVILCGCSIDDVIATIENPDEKIGPAPTGFRILTDATEITCHIPCEIEICYPNNEEVESKKGTIYEWDASALEWKPVMATIKELPNRICTKGDNSSGGIYTLIGK